MSKKDEIWRSQLREAVLDVRREAQERSGDFYQGYEAGASAVAARLSEIQRRDAQLKIEGIKRGSP